MASGYKENSCSIYVKFSDMEIVDCNVICRGDEDLTFDVKFIFIYSFSYTGYIIENKCEKSYRVKPL